jgi:hypothetical protein
VNNNNNINSNNDNNYNFSLLSEENGSSMLENGMLWRIVGPKRKKVTGGGENCIMKNFIICTLHQIIEGWSN